MTLRVDVLTLFPHMFSGMFTSSIIGRAAASGIVELNAVNFRDFAESKHKSVDDTPYGGGGGMVLKPEPIFAAVEHLTGQSDRAGSEHARGENVLPELAASRAPRVVLLCPQGERYTQAHAAKFAAEEHLIFICGHYEGYDERIREHLVTDEISIGDYVLTGGELAAMVVIDSVVRLLPGALGNAGSALTDSFAESGLLEHPHYTRPPEFRGWRVPDVLMGGNHAHVAAWRREQSLRRTAERRPDLLEVVQLTPKERQYVDKIANKQQPQ